MSHFRTQVSKLPTTSSLQKKIDKSYIVKENVNLLFVHQVLRKHTNGHITSYMSEHAETLEFTEG